MSQGPVKEDFLDEDNEIPGQRFCLLSFLSPEKVLAKKELYFFDQFLKNYEINWKTKNLEKFLAKQVMDFNKKLDTEADRLMETDLSGAADICRQARIRIDNVLDNYHDFVKQNASDITQTSIKDSYDDFMYAHGKKLEDDYHSKNNFQTTVRGLKIRGSYSSQEEATARAKKLQRNDAVHNIYVATVGKWLAWDPSPHEVGDQEYAEDQLNELMKSYKKNEEDREEFFSKNPDAKKAAKPKIIGESLENSAPASVVEASGPTGQHNSLFEGPADLALQRKMEREAAANAKKEESNTKKD